MTAQDAFTALFGWETLTLAFYLLAGSERNKPGRAGAAQVTFAFGKVSGAALLAATLQIVAHTAAKSLLFTSVAGIDAAAGRDDLEELRGRAHRTPWSGFGLAVGSLTLAGLPPTAGFVSEWFLLESLMQQFRVPGLGYRLVLALAGAAVALTVGFAGVTFVRLVGLIVLGRAPGEPARWNIESAVTGTMGHRAGAVGRGRAEYGWAGRAAVALLAASCLAIAAVTPLEIRVIAAGLSPAVPAPVTMAPAPRIVLT
jgi:hydrogenase-4 component B